MIAALLLAAVCARPPIFTLNGPVCPAPGECACSECFAWEPAPGAIRYEVLRRNPDGTSQMVGASRLRALESGGVVVGQDPQEFWCAPFDPQIPKEGLKYRYEVRPCNAQACAAWSGSVGSFVEHIGGPYTCYAGGRKVTCP